jgi:raffinose/stachyose/melibiose transport system substrate-binding protein
MRKILSTVYIVAAAAAAATITAAAPMAALAEGLGSNYDVSKVGDQELTLWWLGNQEIPGIEDWMARSIAAYQKQYPNISVKTVIQATDTYVTTQKTACKSGTGPDIWYNWAGTYSLSLAWLGCVVPNEDVLSKDDLDGVPSIEGTRWGGKTWIHPYELKVFPIVYNKDLFKQAGLDPENPPRSWSDFLGTAQKLREAGIEPLVIGLKDGWGAENLAVAFQSQVYTQKQFIELAIRGNLDGPEWRSWVERVPDLKPYINGDTNSILLAEGLARFADGQAAMVFAATGYIQMIAEMTKSGKNVGVMKVPSFSTVGLNDTLAVDTPGFQVTKFSANKEVAGHFMAFLHSPERLDALYDETNTLPIDRRWDSSKAKTATDKQLVDWSRGNLTYYPANFYPYDLNENGNFVVFQGILGSDMTVDQALDTYQSVITKWRSAHPEEIQDYESWLNDYK